MSEQKYWLCCASVNPLHHASGCIEGKSGHSERCRFGTSDEHSAWSKPEPGQPAAEFIEVEGIHIDAQWVRNIRGKYDAMDIKLQRLEADMGQSGPVAYLYDYIDETGVHRSKLTFYKRNPADIKWAGRTQIIEKPLGRISASPAMPDVGIDHETMKIFINRELPRTHKGFRCQYQQDHIMRAIDVIYNELAASPEQQGGAG